MKKTIGGLLILSICTLSSVSADIDTSSTPQKEAPDSTLQTVPQPQPLATDPAADTPAAMQDATTAAQDVEPKTEELPDSKYVGKASEESSRTATRERWQNIALAVGAVAVATVALILVANNKGHKAN